MSWLTKNLTLDLLAITIDGLSKIFDRINTDDDSPVGPAASAPATEVLAARKDPATTHPADMPTEALADPAAEPTPAPQSEEVPDTPGQESPTEEEAAELLAQAQTLLRTIAQKNQVDWITGTLFPHFNTQSLTDIPADRLPEVIDLAGKHIEETAA